MSNKARKLIADYRDSTGKPMRHIETDHGITQSLLSAYMTGRVHHSPSVLTKLSGSIPELKEIIPGEVEKIKRAKSNLGILQAGIADMPDPPCTRCHFINACKLNEMSCEAFGAYQERKSWKNRPRTPSKELHIKNSPPIDTDEMTASEMRNWNKAWRKPAPTHPVYASHGILQSLFKSRGE